MNTFKLILLGAVSTILLSAAGSDKILMEPDENSAAFFDLKIAKNGMFEDQSGFGNAILLKSFDKAPLPVISADGLRFDNKGGFGEVYSKESLRITKGDFAIDVIFRSDSAEFLKKTPSAYLIGNKAESDTNGFSLALFNWKKQYFRFAYGQNGQKRTLQGNIPAGALTAGKFHRIQVSRSGDKLAMFLNGVKLVEETVQGDINLVHARPIRIGVYPAPWKRNANKQLLLEGFDGVIRLIRISDKGRDGK